MPATSHRTHPGIRTALATVIAAAMLTITIACNGQADPTPTPAPAPASQPTPTALTKTVPTETAPNDIAPAGITQPDVEATIQAAVKATIQATATPQPPTPTAPPTAAPAPTERPQTVNVPGTLPDDTETDLIKVAAGNNVFGWNLYHSMAPDNPNLLFSPISLHIALAMAYAGSAGDTARQMRNVAGYTLTPDRLHPTLALLTAALSREPGKYDKGALQLTTANSVWGQEGHPFLKSYLDLLAHSYQAPLRKVDFKNDPGGAAEDINRWVSDQTKGKIPSIISPDSLTDATKLILANAVYFKATWAQVFDPQDTRDDVFTNLDGTTETVPQMYIRKNFQYYEQEDYQAVVIPYQNYNTAFVLILPRENEFNAVERILHQRQMLKILDRKATREVQLYLPRFNTQSNLSVASILYRMGMPNAFDPTLANFSSMDGRICTQAGVDCLHISDVVHQATIELNELGTQASAATVVAVIEATGLPSKPPPPVEVRADHPFIYAVIDRNTSAVLFLGRITHITPGAAGVLTGNAAVPKRLRPPTPTPDPHEWLTPEICDDTLRSQLIFEKGTTTQDRMNEVIQVIRELRPECANRGWHPQVDDRNAVQGCWNGHIPTRAAGNAVIGSVRVPQSLFENDGPNANVRLTSSRDQDNNIIVYWSADPDHAPADGSSCWLYTNNIYAWSLE